MPDCRRPAFDMPAQQIGCSYWISKYNTVGGWVGAWGGCRPTLAASHARHVVLPMCRQLVATYTPLGFTSLPACLLGWLAATSSQCLSWQALKRDSGVWLQVKYLTPGGQHMKTPEVRGWVGVGWGGGVGGVCAAGGEILRLPHVHVCRPQACLIRGQRGFCRDLPSTGLGLPLDLQINIGFRTAVELCN